MSIHMENIKKIQVEVLKILTETKKLIENIEETEGKTKTEETKTLSKENLLNYKKELTNEQKKLSNFEYVVAVVGTMKAGKSMTINAIVGQEILPSREFPMTTLPTLITHKPEQKEPILYLENIEPFEDLVKKIKAKIKNQAPSEQKDLKELYSSIENNAISFKTSYRGQKQIEQFLKQINDLMRIAKEFEIVPPYEKFTDVDELPRIEVEFYHLADNKGEEKAKLTLLDTPGPDEFKHSELLREIFKQQLGRASAFMLLVDYTKMNSQSDVEVKTQVEEVAKMLSEKHLYVMLNKFDQRKKSDDLEQKIEEAIDLIAEDVLKEQIDRNNIYPISAKSAFYANIGLRELDNNGEINTSLDWVKDFGDEVLGRRWEKYIDDEAEVRDACIDAWNDSLFEKPLKNMIATIHSDKLFQSLESPIDRLDNLLGQFDNAFKTRVSAYREDLEKLKENIEELKKDIEKLEGISQNIEKNITQKTDEAKEQLRSKIPKVIDEIKKLIEQELEKVINTNEDEAKKKKNERHFGGIVLWDGGLFDIFSKNKHSRHDLREKGQIEYDNKKDAQDFINELNTALYEIVNSSFETIINNINKSISELSDAINIDIKKSLKEIIAKIEQRLGGDESLVIKLPQLDVIYNPTTKNSEFENLIDEETETKYRVGDRWWQKGLNWLNSEWGQESYNTKKYIIREENIVKNFETTLNKIKKAGLEKLNSEFQKKIERPISKKLQLLTMEIEGYRGEKIATKKKIETENKTTIEKMKKRDEQLHKSVKILTDRTKITKEELEKLK